MTDLHTRTTWSRRTDIPEWVIVEEMDRAKRLVEDSQQIHDRLAAEMGYERVRVEHVAKGDVIAGAAGWHEVVSVAPEVEDGGFEVGVTVTFTDAAGVLYVDPGQFVSRQLPLTDEAF